MGLSATRFELVSRELRYGSSSSCLATAYLTLNKDWSYGRTGVNQSDITWTLDGFNYTVSVRISNSADSIGPWTDPQTVTAHPQLAAGPPNVQTHATATGVDVTWDPVAGPYSDHIIEYNVIYWDQDTPCAFLAGAAFTNSPAHIDGLNPGYRCLIAVTTWTPSGGGFPEIVRNVRVGQGTPGVPTGVEIVPIDAGSIHLTWEADPAAAGYTIYAKDSYTNSSLQANGATRDSCADGYFLFPGVQFYTFCVSSFNGNADSGMSGCVTALQPANGAPRGPTCPAPAPWCPGFGQPSTPDPNAASSCEAADGGYGPRTNATTATSSSTSTVSASSPTPTSGTGGDGSDDGGSFPACDGSKPALTPLTMTPISQ